MAPHSVRHGLPGGRLPCTSAICWKRSNHRCDSNRLGSLIRPWGWRYDFCPTRPRSIFHCCNNHWDSYRFSRPHALRLYWAHSTFRWCDSHWGRRRFWAAVARVGLRLPARAARLRSGRLTALTGEKSGWLSFSSRVLNVRSALTGDDVRADTIAGKQGLFTQSRVQLFFGLVACAVDGI